MADLFISHSNEDLDWTRELRRQLDRAGYTCWMAPDDVNGPVPWAEQTRMAIETCRVMLVVISRTANTSNHVAKEVAVALELAKPMVPIRTEDVSPTGSLNYLLQLVQWIDAFPGTIADHVPRIRKAVASSIPTIPQSIPMEGQVTGAILVGAAGPQPAPATPLAPNPPHVQGAGRAPPRRRPASLAGWMTAVAGLTLGAVVLMLFLVLGPQSGATGTTGHFGRAPMARRGSRSRTLVTLRVSGER